MRFDVYSHNFNGALEDVRAEMESIFTNDYNLVALSRMDDIRGPDNPD